jgi:predicted aspartyl protease
LSRILAKKESRLLECGAAVNAYLCVNLAREDSLNARGRAVPAPIEVRALIDTGASMSCVPARRAAELGLTPHGFVFVTSFDGKKARYPVYKIRIGIHEIDVGAFEVNAVGTSSFVEGAECAIGRDILEGARFLYDARGGSFSLDFDGM